MIHYRRVLAFGLLGGALLSLSLTSVAGAGDSTGFHYGSDGSGPAPVGTSTPYTMVNCGGAYGLYSARVYTYPDPYGIAADANKAAANEVAGYGDGPTAQYPVGGPTNDPFYTGTNSEAYEWGELQGSFAENNFGTFFNNNSAPYWPIIWADVESENGGWTTNPTLNAQVFNGFVYFLYTNRVTIHSIPTTVYPGVYSTQDWWNDYINTSITTTIEWTSQTSYSSWGSGRCADAWDPIPPPNGDVPHFYGGQTTSSTCAAMWQWISGASDYDQIEDSHIAGCL